MIANDIGCLLEEPRCEAIEYLTLEGNGLLEDMIESRYSIGCDEEKMIGVPVRVAYFSSVTVVQEVEGSRLNRGIQLGLDNAFIHIAKMSYWICVQTGEAG